jgi:hypothetical protein
MKFTCRSTPNPPVSCPEGRARADGGVYLSRFVKGDGGADEKSVSSRTCVHPAYILFGAGFPTPPESPTEGLRTLPNSPSEDLCSARVSRPRRSARPKVSVPCRTARPRIFRAHLGLVFIAIRARRVDSEGRRPSVRHSCGVRRPAHNERFLVWRDRLASRTLPHAEMPVLEPSNPEMPVLEPVRGSACVRAPCGHRT